MFHSERLANPTDPYTRELKKLTGQRKKTDEVLEDIKWLEWRAGFYERDGRPIVPEDNILAVTNRGARKFKRGKDVNSGVLSAHSHYFLEYEGPKEIDALKGDVRFLDYRSVVVSRSRCMRARPIFREWALNVEWLYDPDVIDEASLKQAIIQGGHYVGICERRPRCGLFDVEFS